MEQKKFFSAYHHERGRVDGYISKSSVGFTVWAEININGMEINENCRGFYFIFILFSLKMTTIIRVCRSGSLQAEGIPVLRTVRGFGVI